MRNDHIARFLEKKIKRMKTIFMLFQSMSAIPAIKHGISNTCLIVQLITAWKIFVWIW